MVDMSYYFILVLGEDKNFFVQRYFLNDQTAAFLKDALIP